MQSVIPSETKGSPGAIPPITDVTKENFMAEVIEKSMHVPVLVSFYTGWSENCKKLAPLLEKLVRQAKGAIHMARIDFEQEQQLAASMKIQSVPTVVVFDQQRPVDAFAGLKSEADVKAFITRFVPHMQPTPAEQMTDQANDLFAQGDYQAAGNLYAQALQDTPNHPQALGGLAQCLIRSDQPDQARAVLDSCPTELAEDPAIIAARAALDMAEQLAGLGDPDALEQALAQDPQNHQARFDLALILWAQAQQEQAAQHLLDIVAQDRGWQDDLARKQLLKFFDIAGPTDPFTVMTRKKLSSLLFS